ncbi:hypothetical protein N9V76_00505 [Candidatus Poseidoniales archaeon]|nr:hypothetical protein [Candidatus Poseidoniales archaeon]MDB2366893.1 hypothetical protein [Candidatus Poseidoniales archaeon]MDC3317306.1 hypothetical protein [Candidatus Poseidoniaceae archaeon]
MLDSVFSGLCKIKDARHVRLFDQFGNELATTKRWPESLQEQRAELAQCTSAATSLGLGELHEVWIESRRLTVIDQIDTGVFAAVSGKNGTKGIWRYQLARQRQRINAIKTQVI